MTITLCNSQPFTFYLPFHTSLRADQCPIHVPTTCTLGLDPCARQSLFGRTDPYYIDNFYTPPAALSALPQHFSSPFSVIVLSSQYLFQRGPIWMTNHALQDTPFHDGTFPCYLQGGEFTKKGLLCCHGIKMTPATSRLP